MENMDFSERLAGMWQDSRYKSGKSQDYLAKALGVSKKTIQNWESGTASPNLRMAVEWFEALGVPMYPYIMGLLYPAEINGLSAGDSAEDIRKALHSYVDELDELHARELLFLLYGAHGSSPTGTMDCLTAYLHLPMFMRVNITENVLNHYRMASDLKILKCEENVMPKFETLQRYVDTARAAVVEGKESYSKVK